MSKLSKKLNKKLQMKTFSKMRLLPLKTSEHEFYFAYVIKIMNDHMSPKRMTWLIIWQIRESL